MNILEEDENKTDIGRWADLPPSILEQIDTHLNKSDQLNMSLVCTKWSLYRTLSIKLPEKDAHRIVWSAVQLPLFGSLLRHVEFEGTPRLRKRKFRKIFFQMKVLFENMTLTNCQIISIQFKDIFGFRAYFNDTERASFINSMLTFFRNQHYLDTIEFSNCSFGETNGSSIPRLICESIVNTLSTLVLKGRNVKTGKLEDNFLLEYDIELKDLLNLKIINTDYSVNLEKTLRNFVDEVRETNEMSKNLILIDLYSEILDSSLVRGIAPRTWQHLRNICPDLKVHLYLVCSEKKTFDFIFVKYIPLVLLEIEMEKVKEFSFYELLHHIKESEATEHLEYLRIIRMPRIADLSSVFIPFLKSCEKLQHIMITIRYPVKGLEELFEFFHLDSPTDLESANFVVLVSNEDHRHDVLLLKETYSPFLQNIGHIYIRYE